MLKRNYLNLACFIDCDDPLVSRVQNELSSINEYELDTLIVHLEKHAVLGPHKTFDIGCLPRRVHQLLINKVQIKLRKLYLDLLRIGLLGLLDKLHGAIQEQVLDQSLLVLELQNLLLARLVLREELAEVVVQSHLLLYF